MKDKWKEVEQRVKVLLASLAKDEQAMRRAQEHIQGTPLGKVAEEYLLLLGDLREAGAKILVDARRKAND